MEQIHLITNNIGIEMDNISINEIMEKSISMIDLKSEINEINFELNQGDIIIELPVKKKKGRKSKKIKELELEQEKPKEPVKRFPKLSEKIFDVLKINDIEYFYDTDFNLLLDTHVVPVGFKYDKKFVFYSETNNNINQIKKDDNELKGLQENFNSVK